MAHGERRPQADPRGSEKEVVLMFSQRPNCAELLWKLGLCMEKKIQGIKLTADDLWCLLGSVRCREGDRIDESCVKHDGTDTLSTSLLLISPENDYHALFVSYASILPKAFAIIDGHIEGDRFEVYLIRLLDGDGKRVDFINPPCHVEIPLRELRLANQAGAKEVCWRPTALSKSCRPPRGGTW